MANPQVDVYDEEFYNNLKIAKNLITQVKRKRDKDICKKWIRKLCALKSTDPVVKKNRNSFFRYLLHIMNRGIAKGTEFPGFDEQGEHHEEHENKFMCRWSADKRTYIAAKPIPGHGTLVYLAVSEDPSLGWEHP